MASKSIRELAENIVGANPRESKWQTALGTTVAGGLIYTVTFGYQTLLLAPGQGLSRLAGLIRGAILDGLTRLLSADVAKFDQAWETSLDLGVAQLPYNLFAVLLTAFIVSWMISKWRDG